jgi:hypothetical protein
LRGDRGGAKEELVARDGEKGRKAGKSVRGVEGKGDEKKGGKGAR